MAKLRKNMSMSKSQSINRILSLIIVAALALTSCGKNNVQPTDTQTAEDSTNSGNAAQSLISKMEENSPASYEKKQALARESLSPCWYDTGKYRTAFNLSEYYADEKEFMSDYDNLMEWIESLKDYEGRLDNAESIREYYNAILDESKNDTFDKMLLYVELGKSLDVTDEYYKKLSDKVDELSEAYSHAVSFASPEIMAIDYEKRLSIFSDPLFDDMKYYVSYYVNPDSKDHSREERNEIADLTSLEGKGAESYFAYRTSEYEAPEFEYAPGRSVALNDDNYASIIYSNQGRNLKIAANMVYTEGYLSKGDIFLEFLKSSMDLELKKAKLYGYDSVLEYETEMSGISKDVFDGVLKSATASIPDYQRYLELHKEAIGVDKQYIFDMYTRTSAADVSVMSFDDAIDTIEKAVSVLGRDYDSYYKDIVGHNNIDALLGENRESGSYTMTAGKVASPHIFTNYYGSYSDVSALAHEIGHAVNYCYSLDNQPVWYNEVSIFDTEVCSVMNELLLNAYLVNNSSDDEEKLYYVERMLEIYSDLFFVQCMYSELEDYLYVELEAGRELKSDDITARLEELHKKYRGDKMDPQGLNWMTIDHLHYGYYMYKYATAICYASSIAQGIIANDAKVISDYKKFMSAGSSDSPMNTLKLAGIDPENVATYTDANDYYRSLVDEYERLLAATGKITR